MTPYDSIITKDPLLSEFADYPSFTRFLKSERWPILPIVYFTLALFAAVLGDLADSNCVQVEMRSAGTTLATFKYGFLQETNHGPVYLIVVPAFLWIFSNIFITSAQNTLRFLSSRRTLTVNDRHLDPLSPDTGLDSTDSILWKIGVSNRKLFTATLFILPALSLGIILGTELPIVHNTWFGWVQGGNTHKFNNGKFQILNEERPEIAALKKAIVSKHEADPTEVTFFLKSKHDTEASRKWFPLFLGVALLVESLAVLIGAYAGMKILFIFIVLTLQTAWLDRNDTEAGSNCRRPLILMLDFNDRAGRLGVHHLDWIYNATLLLGIAFGAISWIGHFVNAQRYLGFTFTNPDFNLIGRLLLPAAGTATMLLLFLIPTMQFFGYVRKRNDYYRFNEDAAIAANYISQTVWPHTKSITTRLFFLCVAMFLIFPILGVADVLVNNSKIHGILSTVIDLSNRIFCCCD